MSPLQIAAVILAALFILYIGYFIVYRLCEVLLAEGVSRVHVLALRIGGSLAILFLAAAIAWSTGVLPEWETRGGNYKQEFTPNSQGEAVAPELEDKGSGADVDKAREENKKRLEEFENSQ